MPPAKAQGKLFVVGIGPGAAEEMTLRVRHVLETCDTIIGYKTYIDLIRSLVAGKEIIASGMTQEKERCNSALEKTLQGKRVALISGGDSGVYGMAGLLIELAQKEKCTADIALEIVPGIPAFIAAAAALGAPLMNDFAVVSLSDLLTPWEKIEQRLTAAARGDFVVCLYNPKSKRRTFQIERAVEILRASRAPQTPCAIVRSVSRPEQKVTRTTLQQLLEHDIDMLCMVIIGNADSAIHGQWMVTARGYAL
jgi:precorrin-3B C17-methyltransferase